VSLPRKLPTAQFWGAMALIGLAAVYFIKKWMDAENAGAAKSTPATSPRVTPRTKVTPVATQTPYATPVQLRTGPR
jgi:hypothetical protein